jgi:hypothetical protein
LASVIEDRPGFENICNHAPTDGCNRLKTCIKTQYFVFMQACHREATMEYLVRAYNGKDRQTLEWLRRQVGDTAIAGAIERCAGPGKPYVSAICRRLIVANSLKVGGVWWNPVDEAKARDFMRAARSG